MVWSGRRSTRYHRNAAVHLLLKRFTRFQATIQPDYLHIRFMAMSCFMSRFCSEPLYLCYQQGKNVISHDAILKILCPSDPIFYISPFKVHQTMTGQQQQNYMYVFLCINIHTAIVITSTDCLVVNKIITAHFISLTEDLENVILNLFKIYVTIKLSILQKLSHITRSVY